MKFGLRTPSPKKSLKARTTGKVKRAAKKAVNPTYGKKGMGFIKDPEKSVKNAVYHRTTVGVGDIVKSTSKTKNTTIVAPDPSPRSSPSSSAPKDIQIKADNPSKDLTIKDCVLCGIVFLIMFLIGQYVTVIFSLIRLILIVVGFLGMLLVIWEMIKILIRPNNKTVQEQSDD